jgi:hypothetical protein
MQDAIDKLASDVRASVKETCAKIAEIHRIPTVGGIIKGSYTDGYNAAVAEIAAKIREL